MIIGIVVQNNTGDNDNRTIREGAYFPGLTIILLHGEGAWDLKKKLLKQDEQTGSENSQLGPRCWEREWGRKRAGHFFLSSSFLFV